MFATVNAPFTSIPPSSEASPVTASVFPNVVAPSALNAPVTPADPVTCNLEPSNFKSPLPETT